MPRHCDEDQTCFNCNDLLSVFTNFVYLLTSGDGDTHGDEWRLHGIYSTKESAERAKAEYERERPRSDGTTYRLEANIEQWNVEQ
jgi:hypothetical protein